MKRSKPNKWLPIFGNILRALLLIGISYVILAPMLTRISTSLMPVEELYDQSVKWIPRSPTLSNYVQVWIHMKYPRTFLNSFALTLVVSVIQLASCTFIGYGLARFRFPGSGLLTGAVIFTLLVPPQLIMIPLYLNFRFFDFFGIFKGSPLNLVGSYVPFILTALTGSGFRNGLYIYIMNQFFRGMPKELEEAAYVDGGGLLTTFFQVMLPGAAPGMIVVFLFSFVWQWNDYFYTTLFMSGRDFLPQSLEVVAQRVMEASLQADPLAYTSGLIDSQFESLINNAGMVMVIAPLLILYIAMQRYFVEGVERTGIIG